MQTEEQMPKENGMSAEEAIRNIEIAKAEVGWNYPKDYAIAFEIAFEMAIGALRKQIPTKPVGRHTDYRCSVCGTRVRSGKGSSSFTKDTVCRKCFTVLDWSEDNDEQRSD